MSYQTVELNEFEKEIEGKLQKIEFLIHYKAKLNYRPYIDSEDIIKIINEDRERRRNIKKELNIIIKKSKQLKKKLKNVY